jgi:hypothetical protein
MTTNVRRGAGRPAAQAKSNRHAQRTALPPKSGSVGAEAIAEAKAAAQLKKSALDAKLDAAFGDASVAEEKSKAKGRAFLIEAKEFGWTLVPGSHGSTEKAGGFGLVVGRGEERITIEWLAGVFQDTCWYSCPGRDQIKLRNASAAKKRMALPAEVAEEEAKRVTVSKTMRAPRTAVSVETKRSRLPFSEASLDDVVLEAVSGRKLTWLNRISGAEEDDRVLLLVAEEKRTRPVRHKPYITESNAGRTLHFLGESGFRAVNVNSIVRVR